MELWKWDDSTGDFWSRLAKALQQSNISVLWAEQLESRLASVHTTGKLSRAAAIRSIGECKIRFERPVRLVTQHLSHVGRAVGQQTGISAYRWKTELGCSN